MKIRTLALLSTVILVMSPMASAQRIGVSRSGHQSKVSVSASLGNLALQLGLGGHSRSRYRSSSRYVSSKTCAPTKVWIDSYYRTEYQKTWVATYKEKRWVPDAYETRSRSCGTAYQVLVRRGYWTYVTVPAHYDNRPVQVLVPGRWEYRR